MNKTRLAKIGKFRNKTLVSAFVPEGKKLTLKDFKRALKGNFDKDYTKNE